MLLFEQINGSTAYPWKWQQWLGHYFNYIALESNRIRNKVVDLVQNSQFKVFKVSLKFMFLFQLLKFQVNTRIFLEYYNTCL